MAVGVLLQILIADSLLQNLHGFVLARHRHRATGVVESNRHLVMRINLRGEYKSCRR